MTPEIQGIVFMAERSLDRNQVDQAIEMFLQVIALDPSIAEVHNNLGCAYMMRGEVGKAHECFSKAFSINPEFSKASVNIASSLLYTEQDPAKVFDSHMQAAATVEREYWKKITDKFTFPNIRIDESFTDPGQFEEIYL